jgi:hypothetical protein
MADKKINQLDPYNGTLAPDDLFPINQDPATGKAVSMPAQDLKAFVLGGTTAGARTYFTVGVPVSSLGVDGDVVFDKQGKNIYLKVSGTWVLQDSYGSAGAGIIRFTSVYGVNGLSADGMEYTNADLIGGDVIGVRVETDELISVQDPGDAPAFDEFAFDTDTGVTTFGAALPAGYRITISYTF